MKDLEDEKGAPSLNFNESAISLPNLTEPHASIFCERERKVERETGDDLDVRSDLHRHVSRSSLLPFSSLPLFRPPSFFPVFLRAKLKLPEAE